MSESEKIPKVNKARAIDGKWYDLEDKGVLEIVKRLAPAIVAKSASPKMSDEYTFISTIKIAQKLQESGLRCVDFGQQISIRRNPKHQEHIMRFKLPVEILENWDIDEAVPELILVNSHNGFQALRCYAGLFRQVCMNGLVVAEEKLGYHRQTHITKKNVVSAQRLAEEEIEKIRGRLFEISGRVNEMREVNLTKHHQNQLAKKMIEVRKAPEWVEASMVLESRRKVDNSNEDGTRDLWRTFNVIQENLTSAANLIMPEPQPGIRQRSLRPVTGRIPDFKLNGKLWVAMEEFIADHGEFGMEAREVEAA